MKYYEQKRSELLDLLMLVRKEKADFESVANLLRDEHQKSIAEFEKYKKEEEGRLAQAREEGIRLVKAEKDELEKQKSEFDVYKNKEGK